MLRLPTPLKLATLQDLAAPVLALALVASATPPAESPDPSSTADVAGLEAAAIEVAHELRAVPADRTETLCAADELAVSWTEPVGYTHGAHLTPVGPRPTATSTAVNGVVVCGESTWAYMGFVASKDADGWDVTPVPYVEESHDDHGHPNLDADPEALAHAAEADAEAAEEGHDGTHDQEATHGHAAASAGAEAIADALPSPSAPTRRVSSEDWLGGLGPIEGYARHEPQTTCSPTAKPGTIVLRDTLLGVHGSTRNLGISRACHIGGRSEHKEGRAFDWGAYVHRPVERASVELFLDQLLATDADGNRHALARRMGVMYVIWNGRIWSASRASDGWRTYNGPSPHTDHVHISLNWAAARARTSFFTKDLAGAGVLGLVPPGATAAGTAGTTAPAAPASGQKASGTTAPGTKAPSTSAPAPSGTSGGSSGSTSSPSTSDADRRAAEEARRQAAAEAERQRQAEEDARRKAAADAERQRKAEEDARRKAEAERQRKAEEDARRKAAADAERQRKAEEEQRRRAEQEQRKAEQARRKADQAAATTSGGSASSKGGGKGGKGGGKGGKG